VEAISGDLKARVLESTDIVALIGRSVRLLRRGKDFVGLCPFHNEKTPSFTVNAGKQFFHCFGCKKHGNAIDFVIERDRVEFKDALRQLAQAAGIAMPESGVAAHRAGEMQALRDANAAAGLFFEKQLAHRTLGAAARQYLAERGFNAESIKRFHVGLAADAWDGFLSSSAAKKFAVSQLALAGLVKPRQQGEGHYDTFRNRLMFPIRDPEGRVIAFGGRVMPGSDDGEGKASAAAKYLNSPQTPLFDKGRCAFGLDLAKQAIIDSRTAGDSRTTVAVVEGYTDVMMAHQFGCTNVVSTLGTALTDRHLALLARFADRVVVVFDPDTAGDAAVDRAIELAMTQEKIELAVASLPDGLDPDEFLLRSGAAAFNTVLAQADDAVTYKWKQLNRRLNVQADDFVGQQKAVQEYLEFLSTVGQRVNPRGRGWEWALARAARVTGYSISQLQQWTFKKNPGTSVRRRTPQAVVASMPRAQIPTARDRAERSVLGYLLCEPGSWHDAQKQIAPDDFTPGPRRKLAEIYWRHQQDEGEPVLNQFLSLLDQDPEVRVLAVELAQEATTVAEPGKILPTHLQYLENERTRLQQRELQSRRCDPGAPGDEADLLKRMSDLSRIPDPRRVAAPFGA
jgi:DNA primase